MGWDGLLDVQRIGISRTGIVDEASEIGQRPVPLRPLRLERIGAPELKRGTRPVKRQTEAAKGARAPAAWVEEAEMQPRAGGDRYGLARRRKRRRSPLSDRPPLIGLKPLDMLHG